MTMPGHANRGKDKMQGTHRPSSPTSPSPRALNHSGWENLPLSIVTRPLRLYKGSGAFILIVGSPYLESPHCKPSGHLN